MANSCETCKHYEVEAYKEPCVSCRFRHYDVPTKWENPFRQKTNADRIRAMSDEELANFMADKTVNESTLLRLNENHRLSAVQVEAIKHNIYCAMMQWLKQPAEVTEDARDFKII